MTAWKLWHLTCPECGSGYSDADHARLDVLRVHSQHRYCVGSGRRGHPWTERALTEEPLYTQEEANGAESA